MWVMLMAIAKGQRWKLQNDLLLGGGSRGQWDEDTLGDGDACFGDKNMR